MGLELTRFNACAGDRYDGEFKAGQEDGVGIFSWADGATYEGFWKQGQKHGIGLYRPVSTDPRRLASHPERPEGASAGEYAPGLVMCLFEVRVRVKVCC